MRTYRVIVLVALSLILWYGYTERYANIHTCTCTQMYTDIIIVKIHTHMHTWIHAHWHTHACTHVHTHTHITQPALSAVLYMIPSTMPSNNGKQQ